jgi:membrane protease YdiL (CAAX protease family)
VELVTTAWRLVFLAIYLWLFFDVAKQAWHAPYRRPLPPLLVGAIGASFLIILLAGYWQQQDLDTRLVFALTSPIVAMREELFYRLILQTALQRKLQPVAAILLASIAFVLFHIGAQPVNVYTIVSLMSFGVLLGVVYERTRSLRLVVLVHLIVDLLFIVSIKVISPFGALFGYLGVTFVALQAWSFDNSGERMGL